MRPQRAMGRDRSCPADRKSSMRHGLVVAGLLLLCLPQIAGADVAGRQPERGSIALLDATSGSEIAHVTANGAVIAAVPDGRAGWFVGGSFTAGCLASRSHTCFRMASSTRPGAPRSAARADGQSQSTRSPARVRGFSWLAPSAGSAACSGQGWPRSTRGPASSCDAGRRTRRPSWTSQGSLSPARGSSWLGSSVTQRLESPRSTPAPVPSIVAGTPTCF